MTRSLLMNSTRSWVFTSSLTQGVGLAAGFGRALDKTMQKSIQALEYFAQFDDHAKQYAKISTGLLRYARAHLERQDEREQTQRAESSTKLFGLVPKGPDVPVDSKHELSLGRAMTETFKIHHAAGVYDNRPTAANGLSTPERQHNMFPVAGAPEPTLDMSFFEGFPVPNDPSDIDWESVNLFRWLDDAGLDGAHHFGG